jgi:hypothetical protein
MDIHNHQNNFAVFQMAEASQSSIDIVGSALNDARQIGY